MFVEQMDIPIGDRDNGFLLRIKNDGEWIRLSTGAGKYLEGKDWELSLDSEKEIQVLAMLREIFDEEIDEYFDLIKQYKFSEAEDVFKKIKKWKKSKKS